MKKIIIALFSLLAMFQLSCNPIEEEPKQGSVIAESELKLDVYPLTEGGNKIVMINNTPMVGSHWNYGSGISVRQQDTVLVPFLGEKEIVFTGICAGGTISTIRKVTIDNILYPIEDEWAIFAGTDKNGKDWMWDYTSPDDVVWGNGGYPGNTAPAWATIKAGDMDDQDPEVGKDGVMHFDLNGAANFTKISQTGKVVEKLLDSAHITANKNTIPNDPQKPFVTSGIRLGTPAATSRGLKEDDFDQVAEAIAMLIKEGEPAVEKAKAIIKTLTDKYPLQPMH